TIFTGANAHIRKRKNVRKLLEKNKHSFGALTNEHDLGTICDVPKELLDAGIFESASKAQTQFPELFQSSDGRREESEPSDCGATKSEADAKEAITLSEEERTKIPHTLHPECSSGVSVYEIEEMIRSAASFATVLKDALVSSKIEMIQREAGAILEELKGAQDELEKSVSEELAMVAHKRALLDEVEKKEIETMLREGSQNRLRFGSALDKLLVQRQICAGSDLHHAQEMSCAEGDDATFK
ncbi:MAG: hypothetical protein Q9199_007687, partial [Rusavskia elegans]